MKRTLFVIVALGVTALMFQNCQKASVEFSSLEEDHSSQQVPHSNPPEEENPGPADGLVVKSKDFESMSKERVIDMVWVIDNSISMMEEAEIIRKNFKSFTESIANKTNLRVALITKKDAFALKTQVALPLGLKNAIQIDFLVHSNNPMLVAAAATCSEENTEEFCLKNRTYNEYNAVRGSLNSFFRENSQKVFVFVTDDDSVGAANKSGVQFGSTGPSGYYQEDRFLLENRDFISAATFKSQMARAFGEQASYKVFGFITQGKQSKCGYRISNTYMELINDKKGVSFDICQKDWTQNFSALSESVIDYAKNEYSLDSQSLNEITSVSLNGRELIPEVDYTVEHDKITLQKSLVSSIGNYSIRVIYNEKVQVK